MKACRRPASRATVQFANGGVSEQRPDRSHGRQGRLGPRGRRHRRLQLGTQLQAAHDAGAVVIAYDRLLMNTEAVDFYVAYDNFKVGQLQGESLLEGLQALRVRARGTSS